MTSREVNAPVVTAADVQVHFYCPVCSQHRPPSQAEEVMRGGSKRKICRACNNARKARMRQVRPR
jgi:hypothetical protein